MRLRIGNEPGATSKLRRALDRVARASGLPPDAAFDLKLAATEALTNAVTGAPRVEFSSVRDGTRVRLRQVSA